MIKRRNRNYMTLKGMEMKEQNEKRHPMLLLGKLSFLPFDNWANETTVER